MEDRVKCNVIVAYPKPKLLRGAYYPDDGVGVYGRGSKQSFAIPEKCRPLIDDADKRLARPFFVVDPYVGLAMPMGNYVIDNAKLQEEVKQMNANLEICTQKKYVKAATIKVFDMVQTIIIMFAGAGALYFILKMVSIFTGNQVTI